MQKYLLASAFLVAGLFYVQGVAPHAGILKPVASWIGLSLVVIGALWPLIVTALEALKEHARGAK